ncbi:hypothetical protein [Streptomyces sp. NPDC096132]|uniref:hypothetical protein n=1 Tax=Streptomyces sp. NPDC096132 TaxID=3366075 RepID=UPI00381C8250
MLFGTELTGAELKRRYARGAHVRTHPVTGPLPHGVDLLFLVRPDGRLLPVTRTAGPTPRVGDVAVLLA